MEQNHHAITLLSFCKYFGLSFRNEPYLGKVEQLDCQTDMFTSFMAPKTRWKGQNPVGTLVKCSGHVLWSNLRLHDNHTIPALGEA